MIGKMIIVSWKCQLLLMIHQIKVIDDVPGFVEIFLFRILIRADDRLEECGN